MLREIAVAPPLGPRRHWTENVFIGREARRQLSADHDDVGDHDENINFDHACNLVGRERAEEVRRVSLDIYKNAADYAKRKGIIIADTKLEFGLDVEDNLVLIDEVLTPDSSRFWPASEYRVGVSPPSFDKQFVRDYLETLDWDKTAPGPELPQEVIDNTASKYKNAFRQIAE